MLCMRSKVVLLPTADGVHPWSMGMKLEAGSRCDEEASRCMTRRTNYFSVPIFVTRNYRQSVSTSFFDGRIMYS